METRERVDNVTWRGFEEFLEARGEKTPRVTYLRGVLDLMSPSTSHEKIGRRIAAVVAEYLEHIKVPFEDVGAWLIKDQGRQVGLEPDSCFVLHHGDKERPDFAIEVVWTGRSTGKLEAYRALGISEVWYWIQGAITVFVLGPEGYEARATSACLPGFNFALCLEALEQPMLSDVRIFARARLAAQP
jgi:Uma2 family endonuclease